MKTKLDCVEMKHRGAKDDYGCHIFVQSSANGKNNVILLSLHKSFVTFSKVSNFWRQRIDEPNG